MPHAHARPAAARAWAPTWAARLRDWLRREDDDQPIPDEVHADVHAYLGARRAQLGHWFFLTRLALALGLVLYLMVDAVMISAAVPPVAVLLVGYALANLGARFVCGAGAACAPYGYALIDIGAVVLLRHVFVFEAVADPNATMVGLFVLALISYTLYADPKLSAGLSLAALAAVALTVYFGPGQASAAATLGASPFQAFLLVEYLSIACLVTCLVTLRLKKQVVGHSVEMHRRMQAAIAEASERTRRERVEEVDRLKRDFIAVLSHELRGPITPLCTALEIVADEMRQGRTDPEMLEIATDSAGVLKRLICDYTRLAELMMQHEADEAPRWNIPLRTLLDRLLGNVDSKRFGVETPDELAVSSDPYLLHSALLAILRRAELKTPTDQRTTVRGHVEEDGGIVVSVHDPASHLPPDETASLDDPFAASSERVFFSANSGLELILAQHALRRIGGRLTIEHAPEGGTAVRCTLPGPQEELRWLQPKQLATLGL